MHRSTKVASNLSSTSRNNGVKNLVDSGECAVVFYVVYLLLTITRYLCESNFPVNLYDLVLWSKIKDYMAKQWIFES